MVKNSIRMAITKEVNASHINVSAIVLQGLVLYFVVANWFLYFATFPLDGANWIGFYIIWINFVLRWLPELVDDWFQMRLFVLRLHGLN